MARKRFTTEHIIGMLRDAEVRLSQGQTIGTICKHLGISEQSYYRWRRDYGGLKLDQAKRMKDLERENERLRKAVSDLTLDKLILKEALEGKYSALPVAGPASIICRMRRWWSSPTTRRAPGYGDNVLGTLSFASFNEPIEEGNWIGCARALVAHGLPVALPAPEGQQGVIVDGRYSRFSEEVTAFFVAASAVGLETLQTCRVGGSR